MRDRQFRSEIPVRDDHSASLQTEYERIFAQFLRASAPPVGDSKISVDSCSPTSSNQDSLKRPRQSIR